MCNAKDDFFSVLRKRRSIRKYKDVPVQQTDLITVLESARIAPSARNKQDWHFVVVQDKKKLQHMVEAAAGQSFVGQAPAVIVCCSTDPEYKMRCGQRSAPIDLAIAIDHMTLAAAALGLGTCWIGSFYPDMVRSICSIPVTVEIVELLTLGYPAEKPRPFSRLPLNSIVSYDSWMCNDR